MDAEKERSSNLRDALLNVAVVYTGNGQLYLDSRVKLLHIYTIYIKIYIILSVRPTLTPQIFVTKWRPPPPRLPPPYRRIDCFIAAEHTTLLLFLGRVNACTMMEKMSRWFQSRGDGQSKDAREHSGVDKRSFSLNIFYS